jgi:SAM-dependent methyltransferase
MGRGSAVVAYDRMAGIYDDFTKENDYERWLGEVLLPELESGGLRHGRVLDLGCGTGRAFPPLIARGWSVYGCDSSWEMLEQAREKVGTTPVSLVEGDVRCIGRLADKPFDLILALNDVVNYLTEDGDLELAFQGMKRNLAPHGLVCFDANTLATFESGWTAESGDRVEPSSAPLRERGWEWTGLTTDPQPGGIFEAELAGEGIESPSIHRERHWTSDQIATAMRASGLKLLAVKGQREEPGRIFLEAPLDEQRHYKLICIGGHDA